MASVAPTLGELYLHFYRAKALANQTDTGKNLKKSKEQLKRFFWDFCSQQGWNAESARAVFPPRAMQQLNEWASKWDCVANDDIRGVLFPIELLAAASGYATVLETSSSPLCADAPFIQAAKKAKSAFKTALLATFARDGFEAVEEALAGYGGRIPPKVLDKITYWSDRYPSKDM